MPTPPIHHPGMDKKNLAVRVGTALVFAVFFLTLLYLGDHPASQAIFTVMVAGGLFMGIREFTLMGRKLGLKPSLFAGATAGWLILLHFLLLGLYPTDPLPLWLALAIAGVVIHFGALLFEDLGSALASQAITWMGALYLGLGFGFQLKLFMFTNATLPNTGGRLILALYLIVWLGDTAAYFVGSLLGRHKLAPKVSPKKTWEGAGGNLVGNLAAAILIKATACPQWTLMDALAIGLLLGIVGQLGDLVESTWKRSAGVKDSNMGGVSIPGHGGLLDRVDSLVFAAPALYAYVHFVHGLN
ncbi:MAG: phosphatidate cytidylyltransferase [Holophaga sp.]|nr:phosphatidate cytidylyltransferase [Holophaga sp.]